MKNLLTKISLGLLGLGMAIAPLSTQAQMKSFKPDAVWHLNAIEAETSGLLTIYRGELDQKASLTEQNYGLNLAFNIPLFTAQGVTTAIGGSYTNLNFTGHKERISGANETFETAINQWAGNINFTFANLKPGSNFSPQISIGGARWMYRGKHTIDGKVTEHPGYSTETNELGEISLKKNNSPSSAWVATISARITYDMFNGLNGNEKIQTYIFAGATTYIPISPRTAKDEIDFVDDYQNNENQRNDFTGSVQVGFGLRVNWGKYLSDRQQYRTRY